MIFPFSTTAMYPEVLGVHVDAVVFRQGDADLELPGEVRLAVDRLLVRLRLMDQLALVAILQPDLIVGGRAGAEVVREVVRELLHFRVDRAVLDGAGQHMTLRQTSPQAEIVESLISLMPRMVSLRLVFTTP